MSWRVAYSLDVLRRQVQEAWPDRDRRSDGTIGDAAHRQRGSDHNPWVPPPEGGVVTALDLTHDPAAGADMHMVSEAIKDDTRVKYVIFNRKIWTPKVARRWRDYSGSNPHTSHMHVSVEAYAAAFDSRAAWALPGGAAEEDVMRKGYPDRNKVTALQWRLNQEHPAHPTLPSGERPADPRGSGFDYGLVVDGVFGDATEAYVRAFQARQGYTPDGVVDLPTYIRLFERCVQNGVLRRQGA